MTLFEYQKSAQRTCPSLGSDKLDLSHMVLGMNSELSEMYDAKDGVNLSEELADIMWYLANYCTMRNYDLAEIAKTTVLTDRPTSLSYHIQELTDKVKKFVAYNKPVPETEKEDIALIVQKIELYFSKTGKIHDFFSFDISLEKALENNINKLKVRYPEKFTEESAINRNVEAERVELEKQ